MSVCSETSPAWLGMVRIVPWQREKSEENTAQQTASKMSAVLFCTLGE